MCIQFVKCSADFDMDIILPNTDSSAQRSSPIITTFCIYLRHIFPDKTR